MTTTMPVNTFVAITEPRIERDRIRRAR
jgi:hypothetical protein